MRDGSGLACSCLVDDTPDIWSSFIPWLATAIDLAHVDPQHIHIHHVCDLTPDIAGLCRTVRVNTHHVERFDPSHPHSSKIQQCVTAFGDVRRVALTDVDMVFARPLPVDQIQARVAGKLVDLPNPPLEVLRNVFAASGLPCPAACMNAYLDDDGARVDFATIPGNFNGGLYVVDRDVLIRIGEAWARWARWLLNRVELLERWTLHADQVSFCLAINNLGLAVEPLDNAWNFPLHIRASVGGIEPVILHHHGLMDEHAPVTQISAQPVREALTRVNAAVDSFRRRHLS